MADITLVRSDDGKLRGITDADDRRWSKWLAKTRTLSVGDTVRASFKLPRSPKFHARHFAILASLFRCQDQFTDFEKFREWTQVGAGFCDIVPGPKGKPCAMAKSIAWDALEDADFAEHHKEVIAFVRSVHFSRFLWPHLTDIEGDRMVNAILNEFGA